ncbi:MAG: zinc-binding dehydrogenase [Deltaproteobacteria bacterium]|nr:zinc-binding dehydrogenase [Deltaproteobacteria bacterium]
MRAAQLYEYDGNLHVVELPVPTPADGEVLVRIAAAPINPSDAMFTRGLYGTRRPLPAIPGFEGAGTVVGHGGGAAGRALMGHRVAVAASAGSGTWAEYVTVAASSCFPLLPSLSTEQGAMLVVNPLTAWALVDLARADGHKAVVQTAAAGQLGRMIVRLGQRLSVETLNVVRRPAQVQLLRGLGARHVLSTHEPDFDARLAALCRELSATLAFDAVAGDMSARVLRALPRGGRLVIYGALSEAPCTINPGDLLFGRKRLEGFWLSDLFQASRLPTLLKGAVRVQQWHDPDFISTVRARFPLERAPEALRAYAQDMTDGKVLLVPGDAAVAA